MKNLNIDESLVLSVSLPFQIMILCDDAETGYIWMNILRNKGLQAVLVASSAIAMKRIYKSEGDGVDHPEDPYDLIIIDESTSTLDTLQFVKSVRAYTGLMMILITPNTSETYLLNAYRAGVDDCMTKPVSPTLFLAKIRTSLQRSRIVPVDPIGQLEVAGMRLDPINRAVRDRSGKTIRLTQLEYRLMRLLINRAGEVLKPEEIIAQVWGYETYGDNRLLKHLIFRLRRKIEADPQMPKYIKTEQGLGYRLEVD